MKSTRFKKALVIIISLVLETQRGALMRRIF